MKILVLVGLAVAAISAPAAAQVRGSYLGSCQDVRQRGPILEAECEDRGGNLRPTRLDIRDCGRGDVSNRNGRLVCAGGRGERDGDDRRGPRGDRFEGGRPMYERRF